MSECFEGGCVEVWMSTRTCAYGCVSPFFNNVLSIWALGTAIFTQSHNRDPPGGRISHQPPAESPPAP